MSPGDSSLRTGSIWQAFVTGKSVLDSQNMSPGDSFLRAGSILLALSQVKLLGN